MYFQINYMSLILFIIYAFMFVSIYGFQGFCIDICIIN